MSAVVPDLTAAQLTAMLADFGGVDALRYRFMADGSYRLTPIGDLGGRYLDRLRFENYSESTISNREQTIAWLAFWRPTMLPSEVTEAILDDFLTEHWSDAAPNTRAQHVSSLRCFFRWLHDRDLIDKDPARRLKSPKVGETQRRSHAQSVIRRLVVAQDRRNDRVAILTMYWLALRRNELRQIQFRHIDLGRRVITVFRKGKRVVEARIPEPLALELERLIQDRQAEPGEYLLYPYKVGRRGHWPAYEQCVIWENRFKPLTKPAIDKWFQRCRKRAGLDEGDNKVLMHELRHSAGTHYHEAGHDLYATQHFMAHKSAATTERTYLHLDRLREVARVLGIMPDVMEDGDE